MPLAQLKGLSGFLSAEQKAELIRKVTDAIVSVEGEGVRPMTWVIIEGVSSGEWGVGGKPVTTETLKKWRHKASNSKSANLPGRSRT